jgi:AcrR family transcriptional regulator
MEADGSSPAPAPRRRRIPAAEVRERMLRAAQDIVLETGGVTISLEDVSLEDVMRRAQVPRSSVYRLWPYKGDFVDDLLCRLAEPGWVDSAQAVNQQRALDVAREVIAANKPLLATDEGRRAVMREAARRAVIVSLQDMSADPAWPVFLALNSTVGSVRDPGARARIASALEAFEKARVDSMVRFFEEIIGVIGLRVREGYRLEHLSVAAGAMMQGLLMRKLTVRNTDSAVHRPGASGDWSLDEVVNGPLPGPGLGGERAQWSLVALAYLGIMEVFLEVDTDVVMVDDWYEGGRG